MMKKILIDLTDLNKENQIAIQGIKIFLARNKETNVDIIGSTENLLTLKDNKRIKIFDIKNISNLLEFMFTLLKKDSDYQGLVTYKKKNEIKSAADLYLNKIVDSPLFIATFANFKTHRITCIGDLGYKPNPELKDYLNYLDLMKTYMKKAFKKDRANFKLLTFSKDDTNPLIESFQKIEGYQGEIEGKDLLKCDTDIVLGNPHEFLGIISGINHGISIYDEFIQDQVKHSVGLRLFSYPQFKTVFRNFHFEVDQKLTSGGNILLGFSKNIIVIDKDTIKQGVQVSLNLASQLDTIK